MNMEVGSETGENLSVRVLTLNVWGVPVGTFKKKERIKAIAEEIVKHSDFDVVCLQEVWTKYDYSVIKRTTRQCYPYSHYFHSGVAGSGLVTLSKWKMLKVFYHQWQLNGYVHMINHCDWFGGKGVGFVQLDIRGVYVNVYNLHLHAKYNEINDMYLAHRVVQAFDTGVFTRITSSSAKLSILCGDFNSEPNEICSELMKSVGNFCDSFSSDLNEFTDWGTNGSSRITYSKSPSSRGQRIDYVWFKANDSYTARATRYYFPFDAKIPSKDFSFSDHEAVGAEIHLTKNKLITMHKDDPALEKNLKRSIVICNKALESVKKNTLIHRISFAILIVLIVGTSLLLPALTEYRILLVLLTVIFTLFLFYNAFMGTIWHRLETRGLLSAKKKMKLML